MKKQYFKPMMRVVEMKSRCQILTGSKNPQSVKSLSSDAFSWDEDGLESSEEDR
jgi:hypothetical protein